MATKDRTYFKKPAIKKLQVCLNIHDILLPPGIKWLSVHYSSSVTEF